VARPLLLALLFLVPSGASAQYDDEQTEDLAEQDRLYQERYLKQEQAPDDAPPTDPAADRATLQERFLTEADKMIRDRNYNSANGEHYRVQTDDPRLTPDPAVKLLEDFRVFFLEYWSERAELAPYERTSRVFLLYSFHKFNKLMGADFARSGFRPQGHYGAFYDVITLHTDGGDPAGLPDTLVHEAAHQLVAQQLYGTGAPSSHWISEGMGSYFGHTHMSADGRFHSGAIGGKEIAVIRGANPAKDKSAARRLKGVKEAFRKASSSELLLTQSVIAMDTPQDYYGGDAELHYGVSWMLIHFLLHADQGVHVEPFVRYLKLEAQAQGGPGVFYETIGMRPSELDHAVTEHVRGLRAM